MIHNGKYCQKNCLDWLKMANFGHFACFSIFSPKMRLRLTQNGQFHLVHNFSHLFPPKCLIFAEFSKIFIPVAEAHWHIFWVFQLFWIGSHQNGSKWPTMANFAKIKWLRLAHNGQFWSFCMFFHIFPQNEAQIDLEWPISPDSKLFPLCYTPWGFLGLLLCWKTGIRWLAFGLKP